MSVGKGGRERGGREQGWGGGGNGLGRGFLESPRRNTDAPRPLLHPHPPTLPAPSTRSQTLHPPPAPPPVCRLLRVLQEALPVCQVSLRYRRFCRRNKEREPGRRHKKCHEESRVSEGAFESDFRRP